MSRRILDLLSRRPFAVVGHRGASGVLPENTLSSIKHAIEAGVDIVEVDVRRTRDGALILLHDETFERLAGIPQPARSLDYSWIREHIRIGGEPVATLEDALRLVDGGCGLFIEIKEPDTIGDVMELVRAYGASGWTAIISFHDRPLAEARRILPGIATGLIYFRPPGRIADARRVGARIVLPYYRIATERSIMFAHRLGLKVVAWTVNNEDDAMELARRGVDGIATDYPGRLIRLRDTWRT